MSLKKQEFDLVKVQGHRPLSMVWNASSLGVLPTCKISKAYINRQNSYSPDTLSRGPCKSSSEQFCIVKIKCIFLLKLIHIFILFKLIIFKVSTRMEQIHVTIKLMCSTSLFRYKNVMRHDCYVCHINKELQKWSFLTAHVSVSVFLTFSFFSQRDHNFSYFVFARYLSQPRIILP